jgi:RNA recognition motif-containing protein
MLDRATQRSRGFGFVIFRDREGMDSAIRDKHESDLDGRKISVKAAIPQEQIPPGG